MFPCKFPLFTLLLMLIKKINIKYWQRPGYTYLMFFMCRVIRTKAPATKRQGSPVNYKETN